MEWGYTQNHYDVVLMGSVFIGVIVYLAVKGELGKW